MFIRKNFLSIIFLSLISLALTGCVGATQTPQKTTSSTSAMMTSSKELVNLIEDVRSATAYRYDAKDSAGHNMDTAKIIADPAGGYIAVYHTFNGNFFQTHLAISTDLLNWSYQQSYGEGTHQPYLMALPDGGFVLANESDVNNYNWINVRYFANRAKLLANNSARSYDIPHTLVPAKKWAEGTPNIYSITLNPDIDHSTIDIGFHYFMNGEVDRQARGTLTNFNSWTSHSEDVLNHAMQNFKLRGNFGDRDHITFQGGTYTLLEGQLVKNDFGSWRPFLWDWTTQAIQQLEIRTHGGSLSFANPSLTVVPAPNGGQAVVISFFIPSENSAKGEAGQLIYYKELPNK